MPHGRITQDPKEQGKLPPFDDLMRLALQTIDRQLVGAGREHRNVRDDYAVKGAETKLRAARRAQNMLFELNKLMWHYNPQASMWKADLINYLREKDPARYMLMPNLYTAHHIPVESPYSENDPRRRIRLPEIWKSVPPRT